MDDATALLKEADVFNRRWERLEGHGFGDYAEMLAGAKALKIYAAEAALKTPKGRDRSRLLELRDTAEEVERNMKNILGSWDHHPAPGDAA